MYYHLSIWKGLKELTPKIPECAVEEYEDKQTPRVCFSDSIDGCLSALCSCPSTYSVYVPKYNIKLYKPSVFEVRDAPFTHELWSKEKVTVKCIGLIQSYDLLRCEDFNTPKGETTVHYYSYKWIERY